jgi:hypothetical protein
MKKIIKIFFLIIVICFVSSCYEQVIRISDNFNGVITYNITYSDEFKNLAAYLIEKHGIDLNTLIFFDKKKIDELLSKSKDLKLLDYKLKSSENTEEAEVSIAFNNISVLPVSLPSNYFTTRSFEENKTVFYSTSISLNKLYDNKDIRALYRNIKGDEKKIIDAYLKIIKLKFIYKSEKYALNTNIGTISPDKKEVQYSTTMYEELNNKADTEIIISLRK